MGKRKKFWCYRRQLNKTLLQALGLCVPPNFRYWSKSFAEFHRAWYTNTATGKRYWAVKLQTYINIPPLMPDEDKNFSGSSGLDFRKWWRHVKRFYRKSLTESAGSISVEWPWIIESNQRSENLHRERSNRPFATNDHLVQNPPSKLVYGVRAFQVTIKGIPVLKAHGNRFFVYPSSV